MREVYEALMPHMNGGSYVNYMGGEETGGSDAAYGNTLRKLKQVKRIYDRDNFFRLNQNVAPA